MLKGSEDRTEAVGAAPQDLEFQQPQLQTQLQLSNNINH